MIMLWKHDVHTLHYHVQVTRGSYITSNVQVTRGFYLHCHVPSNEGDLSSVAMLPALNCHVQITKAHTLCCPVLSSVASLKLSCSDY